MHYRPNDAKGRPLSLTFQRSAVLATCAAWVILEAFGCSLELSWKHSNHGVLDVRPAVRKAHQFFKDKIKVDVDCRWFRPAHDAADFNSWDTGLLTGEHANWGTELHDQEHRTFPENEHRLIVYGVRPSLPLTSSSIDDCSRIVGYVELVHGEFQPFAIASATGPQEGSRIREVCGTHALLRPHHRGFSGPDVCRAIAKHQLRFFPLATFWPVDPKASKAGDVVQFAPKLWHYRQMAPAL
jgi:hypothetical protein